MGNASAIQSLLTSVIPLINSPGATGIQDINDPNVQIDYYTRLIGVSLASGIAGADQFGPAKEGLEQILVVTKDFLNRLSPKCNRDCCSAAVALRSIAQASLLSTMSAPDFSPNQMAILQGLLNEIRDVLLAKVDSIELCCKLRPTTTISQFGYGIC